MTDSPLLFPVNHETALSFRPLVAQLLHARAGKCADNPAYNVANDEPRRTADRRHTHQTPDEQSKSQPEDNVPVSRSRHALFVPRESSLAPIPAHNKCAGSPKAHRVSRGRKEYYTVLYYYKGVGVHIFNQHLGGTLFYGQPAAAAKRNQPVTQ